MVSVWWAIGAGVLLAGLAVAAAGDLRTREVPDRLWQVVGVAGAVLGGIALAPEGGGALFLWGVASIFVLQHVFAWDALLGEKAGHLGDAVELATYVAVFLLVGFAYVLGPPGRTGVPREVVLVVVTVLFARVLFELGVLYGGADAKALMIAGLLVPSFPALLPVPGSAALVQGVIPFAINALMDAALLSLAVPIAVAARNLRRREFSLSHGFTTYSIPVDELPQHFVWVRDPAYPGARKEEAEIETSEEDRAWRVRAAEKLRRAGLTRVRVSPQLPFLVLLAVGTAVTLLVGNLILDILGIL